MRELRYNTATRVTVGPFLDETDGITPRTALTVTAEKLTFIVDTGGVPTLVLDVAPTASGGANDMVHVTNDDAGFYDLELAAANVNYLGRAILGLNDVATHAPVFHEFMIISQQEYDRKYSTQPAIQRGTLTGVGPQSATLASQSVVTDFLKGGRLEIPFGETGGGQVRYVTTNNNADPPVCTLDRIWATQPTGAAYIFTPESLGATTEESTAAVFARIFSADFSNFTFEEIQMILLAAIAGKASGLGGTTATYRNPADNANVIVATVDVDGNRTAVTLTP